jgi:glutathione synthase/RimK-type ligase-like ATP-grasp enzyme
VSTILVLADEDDVGISRLITRLEQGHLVKWWRFGVAETDVTVDVAENGFYLSQLDTTLESGDFDAADIVIYKRRWLQPRPIVRSGLNGRANRAFSEREWTSLFEGLLGEQERRGDALWLNAPSAWGNSSNKLSLLMYAVRVGLPVPPFRISTPIRLPAAAASDVVAKAISADEEIEPTRYFSTVRLQESETSELRDRHVTTPSFLQEYVEPTCEFRAYFILGKMITIRLRPSAGHVDIRHAAREEMSPTVDRLPAPLEAALAAFADDFELNYCAFDLIAPVEGEPVLIDITPAGSWDYFETQDDPFLSNALAAVIESHLSESEVMLG